MPKSRLCALATPLLPGLAPPEVGEGVACVQTISPPFRKKSGEESSHLIFSSHLLSRFFPEGSETSVLTGKDRRRGVGGGGGDPNKKVTGMFVLFLRG